jgi:hypothetical protein
LKLGDDNYPDTGGYRPFFYHTWVKAVLVAQQIVVKVGGSSLVFLIRLQELASIIKIIVLPVMRQIRLDSENEQPKILS